MTTSHFVLHTKAPVNKNWFLYKLHRKVRYLPVYSKLYLNIVSEKGSILDVIIEIHGNANSELEMLAGVLYSN